MLHLKCNDWESHASSEVSIKLVMDGIATQIISWRKLELACWKDLLDMEDYKVHVSTSKLWFHLYMFTVDLALNQSGQTEEVNIIYF